MLEQNCHLCAPNRGLVVRSGNFKDKIIHGLFFFFEFLYEAGIAVSHLYALHLNITSNMSAVPDVVGSDFTSRPKAGIYCSKQKETIFQENVFCINAVHNTLHDVT